MYFSLFLVFCLFVFPVFFFEGRGGGLRHLYSCYCYHLHHYYPVGMFLTNCVIILPLSSSSFFFLFFLSSLRITPIITIFFYHFLLLFLRFVLPFRFSPSRFFFFSFFLLLHFDFASLPPWLLNSSPFVSPRPLSPLRLSHFPPSALPLLSSRYIPSLLFSSTHPTSYASSYFSFLHYVLHLLLFCLHQNDNSTSFLSFELLHHHRYLFL